MQIIYLKQIELANKFGSVNNISHLCINMRVWRVTGVFVGLLKLSVVHLLLVYGVHVVQLNGRSADHVALMRPLTCQSAAPPSLPLEQVLHAKQTMTRLKKISTIC